MTTAIDTEATDDKPDVFTIYTQERKAGFGSKEAFRRARTIAAWEVLGGYFWNHTPKVLDVHTQTPTVRLVISDDPEGYDTSYLDCCDDLTGTEANKIHKDIYDRIEFYGVVMVCAEWWNGEEWEHADSACGLIGDEWQGSGRDVDLMQAAMDAYAKPLYAMELGKRYYEITDDRDTLLTACTAFDKDPDEVIFTISQRQLKEYCKVGACLYLKEA